MNSVMVPLLTAVLGVLLAGSPAQGQTTSCTEGMSPIPDGRLQHAMSLLKAMYPDVAFQGDEEPCRHARETINALRRTLRRNYLTHVIGYEVSKVIDGDEYFTVERFRSSSSRQMRSLDRALQNSGSKKLKGEANTNYEHFVIGDTVVLMICSARGCQESVKKFGTVLTAMSNGELHPADGAVQRTPPR
jgi:hypothetical protein